MPHEDAQESCPLCSGRGWIVEADGGAGSARRCSCQLEGLGARLLAAAAIPARYRACRLESFKTTDPDAARRVQLERALAASRRYVDGFLEEGGFRESGLIYVGPPGVGKTHLAVAVLAALVERYRVRGRFVEFTALVHQIQSTFDPRSPESKHEVLDPVMDAELLVLDELGAQNPTPWVQDILYLLINTRYTRRRPTLFTTNYLLEAPRAPTRKGREQSLDRGADPPPAAAVAERHGLLAHRLPPMLVSRLCEMASPVVIDAAVDYREHIKMHAVRV